MIFIVGWGHQSQRLIGPVSEEDAGHQNHRAYWELIRLRNWFTLFFIPIIPINVSYWLVSVANGMRIPLNREEFTRLEPVARLNRKASENRISRQDYDKAYREWLGRAPLTN